MLIALQVITIYLLLGVMYSMYEAVSCLSYKWYTEVEHYQRALFWWWYMIKERN